MNGQITTYNSDFISFSYDIFVVTPSSQALFEPPLTKEASVDFIFPDNSDKILELPYVIYQSHFFSFKESLKCNLTFKKNHFHLKNDRLDISVWGSTKDDVLDAFNFHFYSLYSNFALEDDNNLSLEAKRLKTKILDLISLIL